LFLYSKDVNARVMHYLLAPDGEEMIKLDIFSEREQMHLQDVKVLIQRFHDVLFLLLLAFFYLVYLNRKSDWSKILVYSGMLTVAVPIVLYFIPFDALFTFFHKLFFACGTWVFPSTAAIVQIYPAEFWYNTAFEVFLRGFVTGWLLIGAGFAVLKTGCCQKS
jgi:integral membrane protein (TIGR01906 family)